MEEASRSVREQAAILESQFRYPVVTAAGVGVAAAASAWRPANPAQYPSCSPTEGRGLLAIWFLGPKHCQKPILG